MATPIQVLFPQARRRFLRTLRMAFQIKISLHGRDASYPLSRFFAQEDSLVVRDDKPDVRTGLLLAEAELLEK
jgi:hypothetical protein